MRKVEPHVFTVTGSGIFPMDMLRHDQCYPADVEGSSRIHNNEECRYRRSVKLVGHNRLGPTVGRWSSFGWSVQVEGMPL